MSLKTVLENIFSAHLPAHLRARTSDLAHLIASSAEGTLAADGINDQLTRDPELAQALDAIVNIELNERQKGVIFSNHQGQRSIYIDRDQYNLQGASSPIINPGEVNQRNIKAKSYVEGDQDNRRGIFIEVPLPPAPQITPTTGIIPSDLHRELKGLAAMATWPFEALVTAYYTSAPPNWKIQTLSKNSVTSVDEIINDLARASGAEALLTFVEQLARITPSTEQQVDGAPIALALRRWVNQTADRIGFLPTNLDALRHRVATSPQLSRPSQSALLVALIPSVQRRNHFYLQAWVWTDQFAYCLYTDDVARSLIQMPKQIDRLLDEVAANPIIGAKDLTIAFFLPQSHLFTEAVDRWPIDRGIRVPVGDVYPVVVRSLDRIYQSSLHKTWPEWESKWTDLCTSNYAQAYWIDQLTTLDMQRLHMILAKTLCLTMTLAQAHIPPKQRQRILNVSLGRGIPIMLWHRQEQTSPEMVRKMLEPLLASSLTQLPHRLFASRTDTSENANIFWQHVSLLYDDPSYRPTIPRLQAPRKEEM